VSSLSRDWPVSCSAFMGGCKETVAAWWCHWLATSATFTAKEAAWSIHGASKRWWVPQTNRNTPKGVQKPTINETELNKLLLVLWFLPN